MKLCKNCGMYTEEYTMAARVTEEAICPKCRDELGYPKYVITPEEFADRMRRIRKEYYEEKDDEELTHCYMDALIITLLNSLGYGEGAEIFNNTPKWYA